MNSKVGFSPNYLRAIRPSRDRGLAWRVTREISIRQHAAENINAYPTAQHAGWIYIDCANDSEISLQLSAQLPVGTARSTTVISPDGNTIASEHIGDVPASQSRKSMAEGWHTISATGSGLAASGAGYQFVVTYRGTSR